MFSYLVFLMDTRCILSEVRILSLLLPEGRAGEAWESSNKVMLFLPTPHPAILKFVTVPLLFTYSLTTHLSLSLCSSSSGG
jgi:hypothetical protein